jgi:hypothetical protein
MNLQTFLISYLFNNELQKYVMHWGKFKYILKQVTKNSIQKFICM